MMENRTDSISKVLTPNDTGETGGHQAGIVIPRSSEILSFFPELNREEKNPRAAMSFLDDSGKTWKLQFIYYNNRFFGGTRNEYRLTGLTAYIRENRLRSGDTIILTHLPDGVDEIRYQRQFVPEVRPIHREDGPERRRLVINTGWTVVEIQEGH